MMLVCDMGERLRGSIRTLHFVIDDCTPGKECGSESLVATMGRPLLGWERDSRNEKCGQHVVVLAVSSSICSKTNGRQSLQPWRQFVSEEQRQGTSVHDRTLTCVIGNSTPNRRLLRNFLLSAAVR